MDPLTWEYPELTPYQYASNDPIDNIDIDGLEGGNVTKAFNLPQTLSTVNIVGKAAPKALSFGAKAGIFLKGVGVGLKLSANWINHNVNPVYLVFNGINSQFTHEDFIDGTPMDRTEGGVQAGLALVPVGKIASIAGKGLTRLGQMFIKRVFRRVAAKGGTTTVYRNFGWNEYKALRASGNNFEIGSNFGSKQFWLDKEGINWWNSTFFSKNFTAKITGNNSALKQGTNFLDAGKYRAISFDNQGALNMFNKNMKIEWIQYK